MNNKVRELVFKAGLVTESLVNKFLDLDLIPKIGIITAVVAAGCMATKPARVENRTVKMMDSEVYFNGVDEANADVFYEVEDSYRNDYIVPRSKIVDALERQYDNVDRNGKDYSILLRDSVYLIYDENREIKVLNESEIDENNKFAYVEVPVRLELEQNNTVGNIEVVNRFAQESGSIYEDEHKGYIVEDNNKEYYIEKYQLLKDYNNLLFDNTSCEFSDGEEGKWDNLDYKFTGKKSLTIHKSY